MRANATGNLPGPFYYTLVFGDRTHVPRRIKLTLEYDGTDFKGWQVQSGLEPGADAPGAVRTVQGTVEQALRLAAGESIRIAGASRTDTGVHALGQVASFLFSDEILLPTSHICQALNANLPKDVSAIHAEEIDLDFHPQRDAAGKIYTYSMVSRRERPGIYRRTNWHVRFLLDVERMRQAAQALIGVHDFTSFASRLADTQATRAEDGKDALETVREIKRIEFHEDPDYSGRIVMQIEGSGFLYLMVRTIVGSLVDVGRSYRSVDWLGEVLAAQDRRKAGPTAPAHGLCLKKVLYSNQILK